MRQSKNKAKEITAAIYVRLSRDDFRETIGFAAGDSYSIVNQKKLLTKVAKEKCYTNLLTYCGDGISGVTMDRPGYIARAFTGAARKQLPNRITGVRRLFSKCWANRNIAAI